MPEQEWHLHEDRFFDPDPTQRKFAREIYAEIAELPIVSPHGHVDPRLFSDEKATFGSPADLFIIPDHYVFRMLYSQGIPLEALGVPRRDGGEVERDHRRIWQIFADHFHLFRGTPSGIWLSHELVKVFDIQQKLDSASALAIYDQIAERLAQPAYRPRRLYEQFNIEVLCTTDAASDPLEHHQAIRASGWQGDIRPTFRPDAVVNLMSPGWGANLKALGASAGIEIGSVPAFVQALEARRAFFKRMGATATDHAALSPFTAQLPAGEAEAIFQAALRGTVTQEQADRFTGHMLFEMARMSMEDGLVMQLHPGSFRNHSRGVFERFGADKGFDIPVAVEYTRNLRPLLDAFGHDPRFTLILFTLDESNYGRELAPLAGVYPALKLGPPWWFFDSLNGLNRYFDQVMETAGIYNTAGFNDDTRAFASIPARHDLWRRACANWLAGLTARHILHVSEARQMAVAMAYTLAKKAYHLE
jgi:glucuronate isomerase